MTSTDTSRPRRILFMTHAESGQANVHLAIISSLLLQHFSEVEIHLASFEGLWSRVPKGVTLHKIEGRSMRDTDWPETLRTATTIGTGFRSSFKLARLLSRILVPYSPIAYVTAANSAYDVIVGVNPDLVVVDSLFQQGIDAVRKAEKRYCLLSPNSLKDNAGCDLGLKGFTYPLLGIGYTYPLSWFSFILNIIATLHLSLHINLLDRHAHALNSARHNAGYLGPLPMLHPDPDIPVLCMTTPVPGLDYPMPIPDRVICCGPIVQTHRPDIVRTTDPDLWEWLHQEGMSTVLISLGTHYELDVDQATAIWAGIKAVLDIRRDIQVLWKLCRKGEYTAGWEGEVEGCGDRVRIVEWIKNEPVDLLRTGKVGVVVHHGGSNSYHEALAAGIPQIILSGWLDTHDYGARVEYVKVGKWANQQTGSIFKAEDISSAFLDVVGQTKGDPTAEAFERRAEECKEEIEAYHDTHDLLDGLKESLEKVKLEGRDVATEWIWKFVDSID